MELYLRSAVDVITGEVRLDRPAEGLRTLRGAGAASAAAGAAASAVERGG
jgi:hypothetical protein